MKNVISCSVSLKHNLRSHIFSSIMTPSIHPDYYEDVFPFLGPQVQEPRGCDSVSRGPF